MYSQVSPVAPAGSFVLLPPVTPTGAATLEPSAALTVAAVGQLGGAAVGVMPEGAPVAGTALAGAAPVGAALGIAAGVAMRPADGGAVGAPLPAARDAPLEPPQAPTTRLIASAGMTNQRDMRDVLLS